MGILNRRNAVMGWATWQVGKRLAKRKAKSAVPTIDTDTRRPNKPAIVAALAALGGALLFWRKKSGGESGGESTPEP